MSDLLKKLEHLSLEKQELVLKKLRTRQLAADAENLAKKPRIVPTPRDKDLPLSFAQSRLWFLDQLESGGAAYNVPLAIRLTGRLQVAVLEQAIAEIVRRHEVLRTTFPTVNGNPVQVIAADSSVTVAITDLQALPESEQSSEVKRLVREEAQRPFDLAQGPLVRVTLLRLGSESHVLLVNLHHIVSDAWSRSVFIREAATFYTTFSRGEPSPLPELPIQYADFAHWQRQWLTGEVIETQINYWKQQLDGAPPVLELPTDRPRPPVQTFRGLKASFHLPVDLTQKLQALSQQSGTTLFMTLLAGFATLLSRYSGQEDIVVGSPIANRNRIELEPLIGFFVNTLVLRTNLQDNPTCLELLAQVRRVALDAYAHQDLPFEKLVEVLQPERTPSHSPLFQVMFILQNAPREKQALPGGLNLTVLPAEKFTAKFDLTLSMQETELGLMGVWGYNSDLFDSTTIARMAGHFQTLLEEFAANPQQPLSEISLLSETERRQLLLDWNSTQTDYPSDLCLHQAFETQVERTPNALAVVYQDQQLSYRDLNTRANQLAHLLQSLEVGPDSLVGLCLERSVEMVVGLLGILKAGGAYVPLDPTSPPARLAYLLEDAQPETLLTQTALLTHLPPYSGSIVCLDRDEPILAQSSGENPSSPVTPEHLAYVIYTSGSTGQPKGVMIRHRSVLNLAYGLQQTIYADCQAQPLRVSLNGPISFDTSVKQIIQLLYGHTLEIIPEALRFDGEALLSHLQDRQVEVFDCTPSQLEVLKLAGFLEAEAVPRYVLLGGEALSASTWRLLAQSQTSVFCNVYGPTECTVDATVCQLKANPQRPILGRPLANTQLYILDPYLQPLPVGAPGELHIGGAGLARGYLHQPQLTAEKFIPHPFSSDPEACLYKTGDLARYQPDGTIEFLGRIDRQVKIRGFRIELGEIEGMLSQHPEVKQTTVIVRPDQLGGKRLVAYVVPHHEPPVAAELHRFLKEKLPDYMAPSAFVMLACLPLTANGKVDYPALPEPDTELTREADFVSPRTLLEMKLVQIWENVLDVYPIGIRDSFFELGGNSLLAVRLIAQIHQTFEQNPPLATLFQNPTIEHLANLLRQQTASQSWSPLVAIQPQGSKPPFFCVPGAGGNVIYFHGLARHLGQDQPFYGLQARGLEGAGAQPHIRVEDMAADYIKAIQTVQPQGPYLLGGHSSGSRVAFEMTRQMHKQGHDVTLLAIIDSSAPVPGAKRKGGLDHLVDDAAWMALVAHNFERKTGKRLDISYEALQALDSDQQLNYFKAQLARINWLPPGADIAQLQGSVQTFKAAVQSDHAYLPPQAALPTRMILFSTGENGLEGDEQAEISQDLTKGWSQLSAEPVEVYKVLGDHFTVLDPPHVQGLAEKLRACLAQAQSNDVEESEQAIV